MPNGDSAGGGSTSQPAPALGPAWRRVLVKFEDAVQLPYRDDLDTELDTLGIGPWTALKMFFPGIQLRRLYTSLNAQELQQLVLRGVTNDATYLPPNLFTYFVVECPPGVDPAEVAHALQQWSRVELAYPAPRASLPAYVSSDTRLQGFHSPAPDGIDAFFAWNFKGSDGAGQALVDLEAGWTLDHEDLSLDGKGTQILNKVPSQPSFASHGTSVLGIISALDNNAGCVGITPAAKIDLVSFFDTRTNQLEVDCIPDAITTGLAAMSFGDVLLLEAEITGQIGGVDKYLPCEADPFCFTAIRLASALGVVVIEPAATNDADLDAFVDSFGQHVLDPGSYEFRDSGAIVIGGATSLAPHDHLHAASAHGARIDSYGWAENVTTLRSDATGSTTAYTYSFGGTSAAAAMVAGATLCIQGMLEASQHRRFSPGQLRAILRDPVNFTPVNSPTGHRGIPNLRAIAEGILNVAPDVYVRDYLGDTGGVDGMTQARSPDVIIRSAPVVNPELEYGLGSGTEEDDNLSQPVQFGQDNFVYVRVLNRGGSDATNAEARVYWAEPATLITPDAWNLIGAAAIPVVEANGLRVAGPITWVAANIPAPGHYCFVALAGSDLDPVPGAGNFAFAAQLSAWDNFLRFINANNNVAWRNFDVVSGFVGGEAELDFLMRGAFDQARPMTLEVVARLPPGGRIWLDASEQLLDLWKRRSQFVRVAKERALLPLNPNGSLLLDPVVLPARAKVKLKVRVHVPREALKHPADVYVRQLYKDVEVGRVTWRLGAPKRRGRVNEATTAEARATRVLESTAD